MTINKITILLLIIACNTSLSFSQDYLKDTTIISLDNKEVRMTINIDLPSENLIISLNSLEKLCFRNCKSWPQINVLGDHNFLELEYSTLGGTSIEIKNTVIVCVANNKLYNVLYCQSLLSEDGYYDKREYQVKFLSMKRKNKYELLTQVKDYLEDKENPKENYKKMDTVVLKFDSIQNVFFSNYRKLNGKFRFMNSGRDIKGTAQFNGESFPSIKLGSEEYYFIQKLWFRKLFNNMFEMIQNK